MSDHLRVVHEYEERSEAVRAVEELPVANSNSAIPAHDLDLEGAVLSLLLNRTDTDEEAEAFKSDVDSLKAKHFYSPANAEIFSAWRRVVESGDQVDAITIVNELKKAGKLDQVGGVPYVARLLDAVPTGRDRLDDLSDRLVDTWVIRTTKDLMRLSTQKLDIGTDLDRFFETMGEALEEIESKRSRARPMMDIREGAEKALRAFAERAQRYKETGNVEDLQAAIPTGLPSLDAHVCGFEPKTVWVVGAMSGGGKSSLADRFAINVAHNGYKVIYLHWEMPSEKIAQRIICTNARVTVKDMSQGNVQPGAFTRLIGEVDKFRDLPIYLENMRGKDIEHAAKRIRDMNKIDERPLGIIVMDYLSKIPGRSVKGIRNEWDAIRDNMERATMIAEEFDTTVVALSQITKTKSDKRQDGRPIAEDLRGGDVTKQQADVVLMLHHPEHKTGDAGVKEVLVAKARFAEANAIVPLYWEPPYTLWREP